MSNLGVEVLYLPLRPAATEEDITPILGKVVREEADPNVVDVFVYPCRGYQGGPVIKVSRDDTGQTPGSWKPLSLTLLQGATLDPKTFATLAASTIPAAPVTDPVKEGK